MAVERTDRALTHVAIPRWLAMILRRRQFVVDPRYQVRVSLMVGALVLVLLALLNLSLLLAISPWQPDALEPSGLLPLRPDWFELALIASISGVFLMGVVIVGILETHRTAGAAWVLRRGFERLGEGRFAIRLRLRKGDNLQALADSFNLAASALHANVLREIEELERLAERASSLEPPAGSEVAARLLALAAAKRRLSE